MASKGLNLLVLQKLNYTFFREITIMQRQDLIIKELHFLKTKELILLDL